MRTANPTKPRKPYKITKPRERWNEQEHVKFLEAIDKFGRDWKQIVSYIGTRSVSQVRSHAQKHFIRLEKKGLGDVVPPARRKARWADKRSAGLCDSLSESEQDFSALHQQASSSSVSTADHQAMLAAGHSLEGLGSSADYSECQPLSSRTHSLGSLASRNTSFTSPASQTEFITYAQEMLLQRQGGSLPASASAGYTASGNPQQLQPEQRQFVLDLLQQLAAQQQAVGSSSGSPSAEGLLADDRSQSQQCLRQLLKQQPPAGSSQQAVSRREGTPSHLIAASQGIACAQVDSWLHGAPAAATWGSCSSFEGHLQRPQGPAAIGPSNAVTTNDYPSSSSSPTSSSHDYPSASSFQPAAPQLDGAFLAECVKSTGFAPSARNLAWQKMPRQQLHNHKALINNALNQGLPAQNSPNASVASTSYSYPVSSFTSVSCDSCIPAMNSESQQGIHTTPAEIAPLGDVLGLEDIDFWDSMGGIGVPEDPLMQAVEAAMGCTDESEISCFDATTPGF